MKVAVPLAKNILAPLGITAAASAIDAGIQKKIQGSGTTTLIISNEEMNDIMEINQALQDSNILFRGLLKQLKNEKAGSWSPGSAPRHSRINLASKSITRKRNCESWFWK